jgi:hypothetical protein
MWFKFSRGCEEVKLRGEWTTETREDQVETAGISSDIAVHGKMEKKWHGFNEWEPLTEKKHAKSYQPEKWETKSVIRFWLFVYVIVVACVCEWVWSISIKKGNPPLSVPCFFLHYVVHLLQKKRESLSFIIITHWLSHKHISHPVQGKRNMSAQQVNWDGILFRYLFRWETSRWKWIWLSLSCYHLS